MGFGFRKSMSFGGIGRVSFSGRGIGVSTGIKGLRVGVNSRGSYVSGGAGGFYFRESLGSSSRQNGGSGQANAGSSKGLLIATYLITTSVLGVIATNSRGPISIGLFALFAGLGIYVSLTDFLKSSAIKKITTELDTAIINNSPLLPETIEKLKKLSTNDRENVAITAYLKLCESVAKDYVIDENERKLIREISGCLSVDQRYTINEMVAAAIITELVKDNEITDVEENLLNQMIQSFQMAKTTIDEINTVISSYRQKKEIESKPLELKPVTLATIPKVDKCYFESKTQEFKQRSKKNEKFFDFVSDGALIIAQDAIHFITNGHKKIKRSDIIGVSALQEKGLVEISLMNKANPLYFKMDEPVVFLAIAGKYIAD